MHYKFPFHKKLVGSLIATSISIISFAVFADDINVEKIEVISSTPLPSVGIPVNQIPSNVQTVKADDIKSSQALDVTDYLNKHMGSVYINEIQNNPLQPDVNYRGFTASPLLGTPQGLSIYMDGVRMNQPFGDVVSWDLIPKNAIAGMQIMPGSNPLFGLNTLGGALSIQTKNGRDYPGGAVQTTFGSYGRKTSEFEYGGSKDSLDWFVSGTYFDENGWRDQSQSEASQLFGKVGWQGEKTDLKLTYSYANTNLNGNGLQPESFLKRDYSSVFTYPDNTKNESNFVNLQLAHYFTDSVSFSGNTYYRKIKTATYNGDINDDSLPDDIGGLGEAIRRSAAGNLRCATTGAGAALIPGGEPGEKCAGLINRGSIDQENMGIFGQVEVADKLFSFDNKYIVGSGFDYSKSSYSQSAEFANLTADRGLVGTGYYADPTNGMGFEIDGDPDDRRVNLSGKTYTWSLYATDTLSLTDRLHLTGSARYNYVRVQNKDGLIPDASNPDSLTGDHTFNRINPAIGLAFDINKNLNSYFGYNEGSRAPTSIELGCANPDNACKLPNSMAGDPSLKQVVTKTWEAGLRGRLDRTFSWNAGVFNATNENDILFVSSASTPGLGYFKNFGETRRRGFESGLKAQFDDLSIGANYTFLDATYQQNDTFTSEANSSADANGQINVSKGDRIPLVPRNIFKLYSDYRVTPRFSVGADLLAISGSYVRGNENNQHESGSVYLGDGKVGGYAIVNLTAAFNINNSWKVFGRIDNLLDKEYATAGQLGASPFSPSTGSYMLVPNGANLNSTTVGETFLAPGAPRTGWIGVRWEFGGAKTALKTDND
ncbi:TonB-dependent receptor [Methyloradius palustris]|uniref:Membrane protein n=1 Tax=Methyloradius palustris TaxID=2778876 RepID=A0A8D5FZT1_9PROT|nr:TonB-dependent receptor [Methyloradius palustris]BCM25309.1 membrane protein [Methyloradius palustris]